MFVSLIPVVCAQMLDAHNSPDPRPLRQLRPAGLLDLRRRRMRPRPAEPPPRRGPPGLVRPVRRGRGPSLRGHDGRRRGILLGGQPVRPAGPSSGKACCRPQRVEYLWSGPTRRRAVAVSAAEFSTLVLVLPPVLSSAGAASAADGASLASLPVNAVYGWGHGCHVPMRTVFPPGTTSTPSSSGHPAGRPGCVDPVAVSCARYHNVAIAGDGRVYTWGLHEESLGVERRGRGGSGGGPSNLKSLKSGGDDWEVADGSSHQQGRGGGGSAVSSPQLVVGLLPENGGGRAVSVSASESHTAVVTDDGRLWTWGTSHGSSVLGHKASAYSDV
ncbi:hypothetical protein THAOC_26252 [Thalassiosira oceanica]|uniref:Uncharacterized protein n=1 Tax=Thalassiosira oceanica TaxID=159749 RepID=K0RKG7_THAOC|nr:hypothetical protein THAOC_26252 [Thalassiosira oceanica]|eukprot:EJK54183.1 hypothetical protein THAOC_26252 [Thalassiosira oceanica]